MKTNKENTQKVLDYINNLEYKPNYDIRVYKTYKLGDKFP